MEILRGDRIVEEHILSAPEPLVVTMPEPWRCYSGNDRLANHIAAPFFVQTMDSSAVEAAERDLPQCKTVIGLGGGTALDMAKYVAWKRGVPLVLVPSIVSVDACFTPQIAVREDRAVRYVGQVVPQSVVVDYDLIQSAPKSLNRAGSGDILSIHTALFDWKLAAEKIDERYSDEVAGESRRIFADLEAAAPDVAAVSKDGIDTLVDLYRREVDLCETWGNSRPEEGSEHFIAYNFERTVGTHVLHGDLVGAGIFLMSHLQSNEPESVAALMDTLEVNWRLRNYGIGPDDIVATLTTLKPFVAQGDYFYSVINDTDITSDWIQSVTTSLFAEQP